jgi:hypothetical protein
MLPLCRKATAFLPLSCPCDGKNLLIKAFLRICAAYLFLSASPAWTVQEASLDGQSIPYAQALGEPVQSGSPFPEEWEEDKGSDLHGRFGKTEGFKLYGELWNKFAHDVKEDNEYEDDLYNHARLRLGAKYFPNRDLQAVLSADMDYFAYINGDDWSHDDDVRLYEAYINWAQPRFNLKVGNQIVRWGKSDAYSPLDNVNPEDLRDGIAGRREERKIAIPMVNLELYKDAHTLQTIFIPYSVASDLDLFGTDWALFDHLADELGPIPVSEEDPAKNLNNSEAGVRYSGIVRNINYALSYLYSREDTPSIISPGLPAGAPAIFSSANIRELALLAQATGQEIRLQHDYQNIYGLEVETTLSHFGLRGDFAYIHRGSFLTNSLERVKKPMFQYMIGMDYDGPRESYFNLQFFQTLVNNYDEDIITADEMTFGLNGTVSKEFLYGKFKPEFRFYYDMTEGSSLLNPKLLIKYWDIFSLEVGAEFFDGPEDTLLGLYADNDQVYTILEVDF